MPRIKLLLNIGVGDCKKLDLEPDEARAGEVVDVSKEAHELIIKNNWGVEPKAADTIRADTTATKTAAQDDLDEMTKEELKAHADKLRLPGVTMAQSKDEMIFAIRKGTHR